jgi:hypothetical protein
LITFEEASADAPVSTIIITYDAANTANRNLCFVSGWCELAASPTTTGKIIFISTFFVFRLLSPLG